MKVRHSPEELMEMGVERMVRNLAMDRGWSLDRAVFAVECVLQDLKRQQPTPPEPPVLNGWTRISLEKAA